MPQHSLAMLGCEHFCYHQHSINSSKLLQFLLQCPGSLYFRLHHHHLPSRQSGSHGRCSHHHAQL